MAVRKKFGNHQPVWPEKFVSVVGCINNGYFSGCTEMGWNLGIHLKNRNLTGKEYNTIKVQNPPLKKYRFVIMNIEDKTIKNINMTICSVFKIFCPIISS